MRHPLTWLQLHCGTTYMQEIYADSYILLHSYYLRRTARSMYVCLYVIYLYMHDICLLPYLSCACVFSIETLTDLTITTNINMCRFTFNCLASAFYLSFHLTFLSVLIFLSYDYVISIRIYCITASKERRII